MSDTYIHKGPDGTEYPANFEQADCPKCLAKLPLDLTADEARCRKCGAWCSTSRDDWITKRMQMGLPLVLPVLQWPDARLRQVALEVPIGRIQTPAFYKRTRALAQTMSHHRALGLAANQVGWNDRMFALRDNSYEEGGFTIVINPKIVIEFGGYADVDEACLSFGSVVEAMRAPLKLRAMWTDVAGCPVDTVLEGTLAQAMRHEVEHLDGKVFTGRMGLLQRRLFLQRVDAARKKAARCRE